MIGLVLWLDGELAGSLQSALALSDWQPWRAEPRHRGLLAPASTGPTASRCSSPTWPSWSPTAFWPSPKNLAHLLALSAAVLIGIQFWYADQGGVYVLWYLPLLLLLVFRPNLADRGRRHSARDRLAAPLPPGGGPDGRTVFPPARVPAPRSDD